MTVQLKSAHAGSNDLAVPALSYVAALTSFDSRWSPSDHAMIEMLPTGVPPGGVHAVLLRQPTSSPVYLTNWRTLLPTACEVTARVLLPEVFDAEAADACPLCVLRVRGGATARVR